MFGPTTDNDFSYGCRVEDDGNVVFSGWRTVTTGDPPAGSGAVPVMLAQEDLTKAVDVVFIADEDSYQPTDAEFIEDVAIAIRDGYYTEPLFLSNQTKFNFWIFLNTGAADREYDGTLGEDGAGDDTCSDGLDNGNDGFTDEDDVNCTPCTLTAPADWNTLGGFADVGPIFHTDSFRDCAKGKLFSTEPWNLLTLLHETGHSPFGLSDEYCCNTGYFQETDPPTLPNMFSTLQACQNDLPSGRVPSDCRQLSRYFGSRTEDPGPQEGPCNDGIDNAGDGMSDANDPDCVITRNWWTSDPSGNDLMEDSGDHTPRALDRRRINWVFDQCDMGNC